VKPDFNAVAREYPIVGQSIEFLSDLHSFIDGADVIALDRFIEKYTACGISSFETYAKGFKEDYVSIKNAILNRDINNGMIEGFNDKIKLLRKIRYGRAKDELINAIVVMSTQPSFRYSDYKVVERNDHTKAA
jgi:transposase